MLGKITSSINQLTQAPNLVFKATKNNGSFGEILKAKIAVAEPGGGLGVQADGLRISSHADARMKIRGIELTLEKKMELAKGIDLVAAKGGRDALVVMDGVNYIVNIPSRTVVTAVDPADVNGKVFTNIDSALVLPGERGRTS